MSARDELWKALSQMDGKPWYNVVVNVGTSDDDHDAPYVQLLLTNEHLILEVSSGDFGGRFVKDEPAIVKLLSEFGYAMPDNFRRETTDWTPESVLEEWDKILRALAGGDEYSVSINAFSE